MSSSTERQPYRTWRTWGAVTVERRESGWSGQGATFWRALEGGQELGSGVAYHVGARHIRSAWTFQARSYRRWTGWIKAVRLYAQEGGSDA